MGNRKPKGKAPLHNRRASDKAQVPTGAGKGLPGLAGQIGPTTYPGLPGNPGPIPPVVGANWVGAGASPLIEDKTAKQAEAAEEPLRGRVAQAKVDDLFNGNGAIPNRTLIREIRRVLFETVKDGSLIAGLQSAIEQREGGDRRYEGEQLRAGAWNDAGAEARQRTADRAASDFIAAKQEHARFVAKERADLNPPGRGGVTLGEGPPLRVQDFFDLLDTELARTNELVAALEHRLAFLTYTGPSAPTDAAGAMQTNRPAPSNMLESKVDDRVHRAAAIRMRLEALHESLRV